MLRMKGEVKQEYDFVGEVKFTKTQRCRRATLSVTDHYAKDGGPGEACP